MGGGISMIVDLAILSHSISVQVNLFGGGDKAFSGWQSPIHCAAFPAPAPPGDKYNWHNHNTVTTVPTSSYKDRNYVMPDITSDAYGNPIQPDTEYVVKCGIDPWWADKDFLSTTVKTPKTTRECNTGVKLNGMSVSEVMMNGQKEMMLGGTTYYNFPQSMEGMHAYYLPRPVLAGSTIEMTCCGGEECAFFFALYNCAECTGPKPAGLADTLILDGWDTGACSPQFDDKFKTTAFHKSVNAVNGDIVLTYTAQHDEIAALFGLEGSVQTPWCVRPHGPVQALPGGCGSHCPTMNGGKPAAPSPGGNTGNGVVTNLVAR